MLTLLLLLACGSDYEVKPKPDPEPEPIDTSIDTAIIDSGDTSIVDTSDTEQPLGQPVAVCSVNPANIDAIYGAADWIGNTSYDSAGYMITDYNWTLYSAPAGNTIDMPSGNANRRNFAPELAGEYIGQLIVTNSIGQVSEPCYATQIGRAHV